MAKADYKALLREFEESNQSLKTFCESRELSYSAVQSGFKRLRKATDKTPSKSNKALKTPDKANSPKGNTKRNKPRSGNPNPKNQFKPRNTASVTHGGYRRFFDDKPHLYDEAANITLYDDLQLLRAQKLAALESCAIAQARLIIDDYPTPEAKELDLAIVGGAQEAVNRATTKIESIERTLAGIRFTNVSTELKEIEKEQKKAATEKTKLEANQIRRATDGDKTELGDILAEIGEMNQPLLSEIDE